MTQIACQPHYNLWNIRQTIGGQTTMASVRHVEPRDSGIGPRTVTHGPDPFRVRCWKCTGAYDGAPIDWMSRFICAKCLERAKAASERVRVDRIALECEERARMWGMPP